MSGYRVIRFSGASGNHKCALPGWWARRKLEVGAVIECRTCGTRWRWAVDEMSSDGWTRYIRWHEVEPEKEAE